MLPVELAGVGWWVWLKLRSSCPGSHYQKRGEAPVSGWRWGLVTQVSFAERFCKYPCLAVLGKQLARHPGEENQVADVDEKRCRRRMTPEHGAGAEANCTGGSMGRNQKVLRLTSTAKISAHQMALSTDLH